MSTNRPTNDYIYPILTAIGTPPPGGPCGRDAAGFPDRQVQQAVFDGEITSPALLHAARILCATCPVKAACQRFSDDNLDETTFLAGKTAAERSTVRPRSSKIRYRKAVVRRMRNAGVTVPEIVFYTEFAERTVRADIGRSSQQAG